MNEEEKNLPTTKDSPYIAGIDLGTSNSTAAIFFNHQSQVIPIDGKPMLPSVVNFRDNGEIRVGYSAKNLMLIDPENTVSSIKREIGNPQYKRQFKGQPDKVYSATDITTEILSKIRLGVEQSDVLDLHGSLHFAVICVPANFDDAKKQATLEAAKLAQFEVLYLLEEPVAAAIAYATESKRDQLIAVYDLGGGTFDVSILQVDSTTAGQAQFKVLAKEGLPQCGGDDFDMAIMKIVANDFSAKTGLDIFDTKKDQGISRKALRHAQQKLKEAAETAKIELTDADSSLISLPDFIRDETGTSHHIEFEISREAFENAIRETILQTRDTIIKALKAAKITIDDISRIILVGGSTHVPLVKRMLTEMFGKEPYSDIDPATAVARGAAIFAATLDVPSDNLVIEVRPEDTPDVQITVTNIVTHYLGIEVAGRKFSKILDKGVDIPVETPLSAEKEFATQRDNQTEIRISVFQAIDEPEYVNDLEKPAVYIGEFFLSKLPAKPRGHVRIIVKFEINQQNILKVTATEIGDEGKTNAIEINRAKL